MKITLTGEPLSTNSIYKSHCRFGFPTVYMTADGKALKEDYQWQAKSQVKGKVTAHDINISICLYFKSLRKHDIDNYNKILLDALTGIVWVDDSQIQKMSIEKLLDKNNPRVELIINEA